MEQSRWKSPVFWASLVGQVVSLLLMTNVIALADAELVNAVVAGILQILVTVGLLNNPTSKSSW